MDIGMIAALIVFIVTYLLIAVNRTPWYRLKRSDVALIGAVGMIIVHALSIDEAADSIDFKVIFLLLGMMTLVAGLEFAGFFTVVSNWLLRSSGSGAKLLATIMLSSAILSAIALNDAIVLMFTPIVIKCCRRIKVNPIHYLVGLMMSANIGSIATPVGNPQNAYIVSRTGIDFLEYSLYSIPISFCCLIITYLILLLIYRKKLMQPAVISEDDEEMRKIDGFRLEIMIGILCATFIGFILTGFYDFELYHVAIVSGIASAIVILSGSIWNAGWLAERIDWSILLFFIGLFVLIGGASHSGLISDFSSYIPGFGEGETPDNLKLSIYTVVLSNLVSNVPAVMLISEMMPATDLMLCIVLAAASTLAGNTTLLGSAANIIVAERSEKYGVRIDFFRFMAVGIIVTVATIAVMLICVNLMFE